MKKLLIILLVIFTANVSSHAQHITRLKMTCEDAQVGIDSVISSYKDGMFNYTIKWCSKTPPSDRRYIKFELMLVDAEGNILKQTADGTYVGKGSKLKGTHTAGVPIETAPYDCIIKWFYKDTSTKGETTTVLADGSTLSERDSSKDPEYDLVSIRRLKLFSK